MKTLLVRAQSLQEEAKKAAKYKHTAKQQELIIQKLESLMAVALKDARRAKEQDPQIEKLKRDLVQVLCPQFGPNS